jgi:hypothetical protein
MEELAWREVRRYWATIWLRVRHESFPKLKDKLVAALFTVLGIAAAAYLLTPGDWSRLATTATAALVTAIAWCVYFGVPSFLRAPLGVAKEADQIARERLGAATAAAFHDSEIKYGADRERTNRLHAQQVAELQDDLMARRDDIATLAKEKLLLESKLRALTEPTHADLAAETKARVLKYRDVEVRASDFLVRAYKHHFPRVSDHREFAMQHYYVVPDLMPLMNDIVDDHLQFLERKGLVDISKEPSYPNNGTVMTTLKGRQVARILFGD